jgi:hypothetical protein
MGSFTATCGSKSAHTCNAWVAWQVQIVSKRDAPASRSGKSRARHPGCAPIHISWSQKNRQTVCVRALRSQHSLLGVYVRKCLRARERETEGATAFVWACCAQRPFCPFSGPCRLATPPPARRQWASAARRGASCRATNAYESAEQWPHLSDPPGKSAHFGNQQRRRHGAVRPQLGRRCRWTWEGLP